MVNRLVSVGDDFRLPPSVVVPTGQLSDPVSLDDTADTASKVAMTPSERTKLSGVAAGATANDTDDNLKNRNNHTGLQSAATISDFNAAADARIAAATISQSQVINLPADLAAKAADSAVVHLTGNETVGGTKTFSSAPVVPDSSFTIAKVTNLQPSLDAKAADSAVVHNSGTETIGGTKTFSTMPVVPDAGIVPTKLAVAIPVDVFQASDGSWPSSPAAVTQRTNWIGYPGLSTQPATTGRPAAVTGLDSYVLRSA